MGKIGIYGGSFNPVHKGHVLAAEGFVRHLELDRLLLIPAGTPPHKSLDDLSPDSAVRAELLRIAMKDVPRAEIDELELCREGRSYTLDTLLALRERYPQDEFYLLVGTDMFLSFCHWHRYEEIFPLTKLCVIRRWKSSESEHRKMEELKNRLETEFSADILFLEQDVYEISSTAIRRMIMLGCGEEYLPEGVYWEIKKRKLYGCDLRMKDLPLEELKRSALRFYDLKRVSHALGCCDTAVRLAKHYGADTEDAARAGILHDITKAFSPSEQLRLCEKYAIMTDEYRGDQRKLLHGKTAAAIAREVFGENEAVCSAISWHTTGKANMSLLEKIIYIADYIEPNRNFDGVEKLRKLAFCDLNAAMLLGIQMTIDNLKEKKRSLNRYSLEARDYLMLEGNKI